MFIRKYSPIIAVIAAAIFTQYVFPNIWETPKRGNELNQPDSVRSLNASPQPEQINNALNKANVPRNHLNRLINDCLVTDFQITRLQNRKLYILKGYVADQLKQETLVWQIQRKAVAAGIKPEQFRDISEGGPRERLYFTSKQYLLAEHHRGLPSAITSQGDEPYNFDSPEKLKLGALIIKRLVNKNYDAVAELIQKHNAALFFISGVDLLSAAFLTNRDITTQQVNTLLNANVPISLMSLDLTADLRHSVDVAQQLIASKPDFNLNKTWWSGYFEVNLQLNALKKGNVALAEFWFDNNVAAHINTGEKNALDYFIQLPESAIKHAKIFFNKLIADGITINFPATKISLRNTELFNDQNLIASIPDSWSFGDLTQDDPSITKLKNLLTKLEANSATVLSANQLDQCQTDNIAQYTLEQIEDLGIRQTANEVTFADWMSQQREQFEAIAQLTDQELMDISQIANAYIPKQFRQHAQSIAPMLAQEQQDRLLELIRNRSSWGRIQRELTEGAPIPENTIFWIARFGRPDLIEKLQPFGLDLFYSDSSGNNALNQALLSLDGNKTYHQLRRYGIPIKNESELLLQAINQTKLNDEMISVVKDLLNEGVTVQKKHFLAFEYSIKGTHPNYKTLSQMLYKKG